MGAIPRTLFVIINDTRLEVSEPDCMLYHDQWFLREKFTDENMVRRFIDMHVRGYYADGSIYFYHAPTFIFDDQDKETVLNHLDKLLTKLKELNLLKPGDAVNLYGGQGTRAQIIKKLTVT